MMVVCALEEEHVPEMEEQHMDGDMVFGHIFVSEGRAN